MTVHKEPICPGDMEKLFSSGLLNNTYPVGLQRKVFVELSVQFEKRGRVSEKWLNRLSKSVKMKMILSMQHSLILSKRKQTKVVILTSKIHKKDAVMHAQKNDPMCPVLPFKLYDSN